MGRAALITLLYISFAWTLLISHQFFIGTAVATVVSYLNSVWPSVGEWLSSKIDILVFTNAFAWVFVLSSVLPSIILGKERAVIMQFFVVLTLTFVAFVIGDALITVAGGSIDQMYGLGVIFHNPFLATLYLLIPYVFMLFLDVRSRRRQKAREEEGKTYSDPKVVEKDQFEFELDNLLKRYEMGSGCACTIRGEEVVA